MPDEFSRTQTSPDQTPPSCGISDRDLLASPGSFARILDLADDAVISIDQNQRIILFNQGAAKIFGYSPDEAIGLSLDILLPSRLAGTHREHVQEFAESPITARRMGDRTEILARRKDGSEFPAEASISKIEVNGRTVYTAILQDITQRRLAEEQLKASLREKEALLKEVHHRVKNNLQVVSSLLGLQSRSVENELTRRMFLESQNRIHSMALLHESLYQSESLSRINFPEYVRQLAAYLFQAYGVPSDRIHLRTDLHKLTLSMDSAVPCGLIINELVSNSLKYAFPNGREGEVRIGLSEAGDGGTRLTVADNGVGLPRDVNLSSARTLGLRLVRTLSDQLGAKVEVSALGGTEVRLTFKTAA